MDIYFAVATVLGALALVVGYLLLRGTEAPSDGRPAAGSAETRHTPHPTGEQSASSPAPGAGLRTLTRTAATLSRGMAEPEAAVARGRGRPEGNSYAGGGTWQPTLLDDLEPLLLARLRDNLSCLTKLSGTNFRISIAVANPDTDIQEVVQLVSTDPELAARILRVANSPSLGLKCQVKELSRAIVVLGFAEVRALALRTCLDGMLNTVSFRTISERLWRHSYMCSVAALNIAQSCRKTSPALASTLGLLHDFGRLAISAYDTALFYELERGRMGEDSEPRLRREESMLGIGHAALGALVVRQWGLPDDLVQGINYHNLPYFAEPDWVPKPHRAAVSIIHCAESLSHWVEGHRRDSEVAKVAGRRWQPPKDYLRALGPSATAESIATPEVIQRILKARDLASASEAVH